MWVIEVDGSKANTPGGGFFLACYESGLDSVSFVFAAGGEGFVESGVEWRAGLMLKAFLEEVAEPSPFCAWCVIVCGVGGEAMTDYP